MRRRVPFATRTLFHDRLRLLMSLVGIAFAVLLVLLLRGIKDGTVAKSTAYIDRVGADVFVAREGVANMTLAVSVLPQGAITPLEAIPGVERVAGIVRVPVIVSRDAERRPANLIGFDPNRGLGGPWSLTEGRAPSATGEVTIAAELAGSFGAGVGDELQIAGKSFQIVGLSGETAAIAGKIVFLTLADAQRLAGLGENVSFILIRLKDHSAARQVAKAINDSEAGVSALTRDEISQNDRDLLGDLFVAPIQVMSTAGLLVGLAIVGLTMYTTTAERLRDFGVLKAIGAPSRFLLRVVATQAAFLVGIGFVLGFLAVEAAGPIIIRLFPDIGVAVSALSVGQLLGEMVVMGVIGAGVPVVRILRVDPLLVFRR